MNATYPENYEIDSNKRIIEAYLGEDVCRESAVRKALAKAVSVLTCAKAKRVAKLLGAALTLVGFVGIVGAMEAGSVSLALGAALCCALLPIEYLCIRHR